MTDLSTRAPEIPILRASIRPPRVSNDAIHRPRLMSAMRACLRHPVVVLVAPAGLGKTTLMAQWVQEAAPPAAWLTASPELDEPARFWVAMREALLPVMPQVASCSSAPVGSTAFLVDLINTVEEATDDDAQSELLVIIDDCHHITHPVLVEQLDLFARSLRSPASLVIGGRSIPQLDLSSLRADRRLSTFPDAELPCTAPEASEMINRRFGLAADPEQLQRIMELTEGCPAWVCVLASGLHDALDDPAPAAFEHAARELQACVEHRILGDLPSDLLDFVVATSVFDHFDGALCQHCLGTSPLSTMDALRRRRLLTTDAGTTVGWVRYPAAVRWAALARLEAIDAPRAQAMRSAGAAWHVAHDHPVEAIDLLIAAGSSDAAAALIEDVIVQQMRAGHLHRVGGWLRTLPMEVVRERPLLCRRGLLFWLIFGHDDESARWGQQWTSHHRETLQRECIGDLHAAVRAAQLGDLHAAVAAALPAANSQSSELSEVAYARIVAARCLFLTMCFADAGDMARGALTVASYLDDLPLIAAANGVLALLAVWTGRRSTALLHVADARRAMITLSDVTVPRALRELVVAEALIASSEQRVDDARLRLDTARTALPNQEHDVLYHGFVALLWARQAARVGRADASSEAAVQRAARRLDLVADAGPLILDLRLKVGWNVSVPHARARGLHRDQLSKRELVVLQLMRGSLTLNEIASELHLSINTIKTHARNIYRKTGTRNREEAVRVAFSRRGRSASSDSPAAVA